MGALPAAVEISQKQSVRVRRFALAAVTYLLILPLLAVAAHLGYMRAGPAIAIATLMLAWNALLLAVFTSGLNLRFRDPSLTTAQLFFGITLVLYALYHLDAGRGPALGLLFVVFLFGIFRIGTAQFVGFTLYTLAGYAVAIVLLLRWRPHAVQDVRLEWFSWLVLATALPWFGVLGGKISALRARLRARNQELQQANATIQAMATRDEVTGLYNRAFFSDSLRHALAQAARQGRAVAVVFIDGDRFKRVNDTLGHDAGDRVLRELGQRIRRSVRESDLVARFGGDEFAVLIEGLASREAAGEVAAKIVSAMNQPMDLGDGRRLALSISAGIACAPADGRDAQALLRAADAAMYRAKRRGRNGYSFFLEEPPAPAGPKGVRTARRSRLTPGSPVAKMRRDR